MGEGCRLGATSTAWAPLADPGAPWALPASRMDHAPAIHWEHGPGSILGSALILRRSGKQLFWTPKQFPSRLPVLWVRVPHSHRGHTRLAAVLPSCLFRSVWATLAPSPLREETRTSQHLHSRAHPDPHPSGVLSLSSPAVSGHVSPALPEADTEGNQHFLLNCWPGQRFF